MVNNTNRTWAEISIDAIYHNIREFRRLVGEECKIMACVKADAYGHGAVEMARVLMNGGVDAFGVAFIDEAKQLRQSGVQLPILILGHTPVESAMDAVEFNIIPAIYNFSMAKAISNAAQKRDVTAKIHIKVDTGMGRIGYLYNHNAEQNLDTVNAILDLTRLPNIEIEGLFTHLSCADDEFDAYSERQYALFLQLIRELEERGLHIPIKHMANSAATMRYPHMRMDMVRLGIATYGLYPSCCVPYPIKLIPAMQLKTIITHIKDVDQGELISYGGIHKTPRRSRIATLPIGYADGYSRALSGKARVIVGSQYAEVVGRICMDQCMIDITNVNNINIEDEVTLFGESEGKRITVEEVAEKMGTISYEAICVIGKRVPRIYKKSGSIVKTRNYLV